MRRDNHEMDRDQLAARFSAKYEVDPECGCWLWTASTTHNGYGQLALPRAPGVKHQVTRAHRVSWELHRGPIPAGMDVLHHCDVRRCVNPDHLFLGTNVDNQADMDAKGRRSEPPHVRGEANNKAVLTEAEVLAIRSAEGTLESIGARYGIGKSHVSQIKRRELWAHLP